MNKKDISKVLLTGSARQRATILAEDDAQYSKTGGGFLTKSERQSLYDSFKTPAEGRIYNKYLEIRRRVKNSISYLKQLQLLHEVSIGYLTGYCLLWEQYLTDASLYNQLLYLIKDPKVKKEAIKTLTESVFSPQLGTTINRQDEYGTQIEIIIKDRPPKDRKGNLTNPVGLGEIIEAYSEKATHQLKEAKALAKALLEYMDEEGFNVKTHKEIVKEILEALSTDRAVTWRYSKKAHEYFSTGLEKDFKGETLKKLKDKADYMETAGRFMVFPDPDVEPDPDVVTFWINGLKAEQQG